MLNMKRQMLVIGSVLLTLLLFVGAVGAQDANKRMKMDMSAMNGNPHSKVMMAYRQNVAAFAMALREMTKDGKLADIELARGAFGEIKRSLERMDAIHQSQLDMMSPEMREMSKPQMEKMESQRALVNGRVLGLETALGATSPDAGLIYRQASELLLQMKRMGKGDNRMKMGSGMNRQ